MRNITLLDREPHELSLLRSCRAPETLEDIAIQMEYVSGDGDAGVAHIEADRLLILALEKVATIGNLPLEEMKQVSEIIAAFNAIGKYYE